MGLIQSAPSPVYLGSAAVAMDTPEFWYSSVFLNATTLLCLLWWLMDMDMDVVVAY